MFAQNGYAESEWALRDAEVQTIRRDFAEADPKRVGKTLKETDGESIYIWYDVHDLSPAVRDLVRRCGESSFVTGALGDDHYLYQSKYNPKLPFIGSYSPWHQDFSFWHKRDKMPTPQALTVAVFLDDVSAVNSPLVVFAGSSDEELIETDASCLISREKMLEICSKYEPVPLTGPAGSVFFFDSLVVHGSSPNTSPFSRNIIFLTYCATANTPPADAMGQSA